MTHEALVEEICQATDEIFGTMVPVDVVRGTPVLESGNAGPSEGVAAIISIVGEWNGVGRISCPAKLACHLSGEMLATHFDHVNEEVLDAMAEIANMVIGGIKTRLECKLGPMGLGIPTVIYGCNFATRSLAKQTWSVVPYTCGTHTMTVQMMLTEPGKTGAMHASLGLHAVHG